MDTVPPPNAYRAPYRFRNSEAAIRRFPFPFASPDYMYSVNMEPHRPGPTGSVVERCFDLDEHYLDEVADKDLVLRQDPLRCQSLPHMEGAGWEFLAFMMRTLTRDYPDRFRLREDGDRWTWCNAALGLERGFRYGDRASLGTSPLEYIGRQVQGDFLLLDQRESNLWLDAGILTGQGKWSLDFDLGMNFHEWHAPVPVAGELGVFDRALKFLLGLRDGEPMRRLNWSISVNPRLDTGLETSVEWGRDHKEVTAGNVGQKLQLRVELQGLFRLPVSNTVMFSIRTYLISLEELSTVPGWARRFHDVLAGLDPRLVAYKGLAPFQPLMLPYLAARG